MVPRAVENIGEVEQLKVITLLDDYSGYESPFLGHHGISILLDLASKGIRKKVLLDVGQSAEPIFYNMKLLGIKPESIDMIVLSHCHYDHTGGLAAMLREIKKEIPVVAHPTIFRENYIFSPCLRNIGMAGENCRQKIIESGAQLVLVDEPFRLMDGLVSTGEVKRVTDFEVQGIGTYNIEDGKVVPDKIIDDLSLVVNIKDKGLLVVAGCSHAGIINIIKHAVKITGISKVYGVIGGFHLIEASEERINKTVGALAEMGLELVVSGHCTGLKALSRMSEQLGDKFTLLHAGKIIDL